MRWDFGVKVMEQHVIIHAFASYIPRPRETLRPRGAADPA